MRISLRIKKEYSKFKKHFAKPIVGSGLGRVLRHNFYEGAGEV